MRLKVPRKPAMALQVAQGVPLPAPVGGLDAVSPLANMPVDRAVQLDNWVCKPGWIEPRRGFIVQSTGLGSSNIPVQSLMAYNGFAGVQKLFGVAAGIIYDCTAVGPALAVPGISLTNSRVQHVMISNAAAPSKQYLILANGADSPVVFDGSTWSQPSYTQSGVIATFRDLVGGSGYVNGTYSGVVLTGGLGTGAVVDINISGNSVSTVTLITDGGLAYIPGDVLSAPAAALGGLGDGFSITVATVTGPGTLFDATKFVGVNVHQQRLWFVQANSTDPVYLANVGAISGPAIVFPLGQLMSMGGYLMAIGRWTVDTRQTVDEYIAFISSRGEVIVYQGTDPTTSSTWSLVGIYKIGPPIGRRCFLRISGDLQIITVDGVVGMSEMLSTDRAATNRVSLTSIIMNQMAEMAQLYKSNFGWQLIEFPIGTLAIMNIPQQENHQQIQFVMNTITGAWSRFIGLNPDTLIQDANYGINANCWEVTSTDKIYFGGNDGTVYQWNVGMGDNTKNICCLVKDAYNSFGNAAQFKRYLELQPLITTTGNFIPAIGINVDFKESGLLSIQEPVPDDTSLWNQVNWNEFNWPESGVTTNNWITVVGAGHYVSIVMQITTVPNPNNPTFVERFQLNGWNILAEDGAFI